MIKPTFDKQWFLGYVDSIRKIAFQPRIDPDFCVEVHNNFAKYDPKFAELSKRSNDAAHELMDYVLSRTEK